MEHQTPSSSALATIVSETLLKKRCPFPRRKSQPMRQSAGRMPFRSSLIMALENLGLARRVVSPGDRKFRYVTVTDHDLMRSAIMANMKEEVKLMLFALDVTERDRGTRHGCADGVRRIIDDARSFYRQTDRLLDLVSRHSTDEMLDILDRARG